MTALQEIRNGIAETASAGTAADPDRVREIWRKIFRGLPENEKIQAADALFSSTKLKNAAAEVLRGLFGTEVSFSETVRLLAALPCLRSCRERIGTIGIAVRRLTNGGVERVVSLLIPVLRSAGYETVLLTDEPASEQDYPVPGGVKRIVLPESGAERMKALAEAIDACRLDALFLHAYSSPETVFDMLTGKLRGIPAVMTWHNTFSVLIRLGVRDFLPLLETARFADKTIAQSRCDETFFRDFGACAEYVPNPPTFQPDPGAFPADAPVILFPARLAVEKRPADAVKIFLEVRKTVPEAKLLLAGKCGDPAVQEELDALLRSAAPGAAPEFLGYRSDMDAVFARAKIMLMTSSAEGFPMTVLEAKARGIPVVAYDLPYVETMKPGSGVVSVPQRDIRAAAREIVRLLTDPEWFRAQSGAAREDARAFASFDFAGKYRGIFDPASFPAEPAPDGARFGMLETLLESVSELIPSAYRKGMLDERERITHGLTFRAGRLLTALPLWLKRRIFPGGGGAQ